MTAAAAGAAKALSDAGNAAEARSSNLAGLNSVLLMLGVLAAATIVVLMSRSLTRSLRILRTSALDIAGHRLPHAVEAIRSGATSDVTIEPVPLHTRDEIGEVARAFDEVHREAVRLAAEQAALRGNVSAMFVNLSRRSQTLVERQLHADRRAGERRAGPGPAWRTCSSSTTSPPACAATARTCWCSPARSRAAARSGRCRWSTCPRRRCRRSSTTSGSRSRRHREVAVVGPRRQRHRPPARRAARERDGVLPARARCVVQQPDRTAAASMLVEITDQGIGMPDEELADANRRLSRPAGRRRLGRRGGWACSWSAAWRPGTASPCTSAGPRWVAPAAV